MVRIQGGAFQLGGENGSGEETNVQTVTLKTFWMCDHEVTNAEFNQFVEESGYDGRLDADTKTGYLKHLAAKGGMVAFKPLRSAPSGNNYPVVCVSWVNAVRYCEWLTKKTGRKYTLPTEAQWEYACRAKSLTDYAWKSWSDVKINEWVEESSNMRNTHEIRKKSANGFGLYDMQGNVMEWCLSRVVSCNNYSDTDGRNAYDLSAGQRGVKDTSYYQERILRGGCYSSTEKFCRVFSRNMAKPKTSSGKFGFRVCSPVDPR